MVLQLAVLLMLAVYVTARWAWRYQFKGLAAHGPRLLRNLEVHITAVLVHERSAMVGLRDEANRRGVEAIMVSLGHERDVIIGTLERWRDEGASLHLLRWAQDHVELRNPSTSQTLALALIP